MILLKGENKNVFGSFDKEKNVFQKNVSKEKHLFRKLNAWAIDESIFSKILLPRNSKIIIFDKDNQDYYKIQAEKFKEKSSCFQFGSQGRQLFCPITEFEKSKV
jgi:hypothetical protein